jgi:hypothetical protein
MEQPERTTVAREADRIQRATASGARRRALTAGSLGNLAEWYDFALYGALATLLAAAFFPEADPASGRLAAFAVFGGTAPALTTFLVRRTGVPLSPPGTPPR